MNTKQTAMNSLIDIWKNPKERIDFIIALIVCALFGVGILYLLPENNTDTSKVDQMLTIEEKVSKSHSIHLQKTRKDKDIVIKKILTDEDLESDKKLTDGSNTKLNNNKFINEGVKKNAISSNNKESSKSPKTSNISTKPEKDTSKIQLDSLKTTDFEELNDVDEIEDNSLKDSEVLVENDSGNVTDIEGDSNSDLEKKGDVDDSSEMATSNKRTGIGKNTKSEENSKNKSDKKNTKPNDDKPTSIVKSPKTKPKKDNVTYQSGDCIIVVGAFEKSHNAKKIIRQLKSKGYSVKTGWRKGLKYVGVPIDCKQNNTLQPTLQKLRTTFDIEAWVLKP